MKSLLEKLGVLEKTDAPPPPAAPVPSPVEPAVSVTLSPHEIVAQAAQSVEPPENPISLPPEILADMIEALRQEMAGTDNESVSIVFDFWEKFVKISQKVRDPQSAAASALAVMGIEGSVFTQHLKGVSTWAHDAGAAHLRNQFLSAPTEALERSQSTLKKLERERDELNQALTELMESLNQVRNEISDLDREIATGNLGIIETLGEFDKNINAFTQITGE